MEGIPLQWILEVPPVTRTIALGMVAFATLASTGVLPMSDCYYSYDAVFVKGQYYRIITCLFYTGPFNGELLFNLFMLVPHSQSLENGFVRSRDYLWLLFIICTSLLLYDSYFVNKVLLNDQLNDVLNYIWSRRNPNAKLTFLGLVTFDAIYLPFIHAIPSLLYGPHHKFISSLLLGHLVFFLIDTYPSLHNGCQPLAPIWDWGKTRTTDEVNEDEVEVPQVEQIEDQQEEEFFQEEMNEEIIDEGIAGSATGVNRVAEEQELQQRDTHIAGDL